MRYYKIELSDGNATQTYTSHPNGVAQPPDPGALNVELDVSVVNATTPQGYPLIRIWGIGIQTVGRAGNLNNKTINLYGGMGIGLPLANPGQSGLLFSGTVLQAFGNWQDINQTLDLICTPFLGNVVPQTPANIVHNQPAGQPMDTAIKNALSSAYPSLTPDVSVNGNLVSSTPLVGFFATIEQYAEWIYKTSKSLLNQSSYNGAVCSIHGGKISINDGSTKNTPIEIKFTDLIGQPSWVSYNEIMFQCAMRADIKIGSYVTLPKTQISQSQQSYSQFKQQSQQQGTLFVNQVRHVGNFRQADANAWVTTIRGVQSPDSSTTDGGSASP